MSRYCPDDPKRLPIAATLSPHVKIGILEKGHAGHRLMFIRLLFDTDRAESLTLFTTEESHRSHEFQIHLSTLEQAGKLNVKVVGQSTERPGVILRRALATAKDLGIKHILIPDADSLLGPLCTAAVFRKDCLLPNLTLVLMRTETDTQPWQRSFYATIAKRVLVRLFPIVWPKSNLFFLSDAFGKMKKRRGYKSLAPVSNPPPEFQKGDPKATRAALGVEDDEFLIGLVGMVNAYKRPDLTIAALSGLPENVRLLIAGPTDDDTTRLLSALPPNIDPVRVLHVNRYLSEAALSQYIAACDTIILTYANDHPSATLVSTVRAGVPVVAAGSPWLTQIVKELGLGIATKLSAAAVRQAICTLMSNPNMCHETIASARGMINPNAFAATLLDTTLLPAGQEPADPEHNRQGAKEANK